MGSSCATDDRQPETLTAGESSQAGPAVLAAPLCVRSPYIYARPISQSLDGPSTFIITPQPSYGMIVRVKYAVLLPFVLAMALPNAIFVAPVDAECHPLTLHKGFVTPPRGDADS